VQKNTFKLTSDCKVNSDRLCELLKWYDMNNHLHYSNGSFRGACVCAVLIALGVSIERIGETWVPPELLGGDLEDSLYYYLDYLRSENYTCKIIDHELGLDEDNRNMEYQTEFLSRIKNLKRSKDYKFIVTMNTPDLRDSHIVLVDHGGNKIVDTCMGSKFLVYSVTEVYKIPYKRI